MIIITHKKLRIFPTLPVLNAAGYALSINNYWAVIGGSFQDYVGGQNLNPVGGVILAADRLGNANGSFQTPSNSYALAPPGIYFPAGNSFSITMWVLWVTNTGVAPFMDFGNGPAADNIYIVGNSPTACSLSVYWSVYQNTLFNLSCPTTVVYYVTNVWYHMAFTYSWPNLTSSIYFNGVRYGSKGSQYQIRNVTRLNNTFGRDSWGNYTNWRFDEIKFHGKELSAAEVANDYGYSQSYITFL
jgi:hypothetical protein